MNDYRVIIGNIAYVVDFATMQGLVADARDAGVPYFVDLPDETPAVGNPPESRYERGTREYERERKRKYRAKTRDNPRDNVPHDVPHDVPQMSHDVPQNVGQNGAGDTVGQSPRAEPLGGLSPLVCPPDVPRNVPRETVPRGTENVPQLVPRELPRDKFGDVPRQVLDGPLTPAQERAQYARDMAPLTDEECERGKRWLPILRETIANAKPPARIPGMISLGEALGAKPEQPDT